MDLNILVIKLISYSNLPEPTKLEEIIAVLDSLEKFLRKLSTKRLDRFRYEHDQSLRFVKQKLVSIKNPKVRSFHDKIFKNLLHYDGLKRRVTLIFEQFIQGITLFDNEMKKPIADITYHRDASCGPRDLDREQYKDTRSCKITHGNPILKENKKLVYKCYLERLIYDEMYKQYTLFFPDQWDQESYQDRGHRDMLEDVRKDFESCYPNMALSVVIKYTTQNIPYFLEITKHSKKYQQIIEVETYVRVEQENKDIARYNDMYLETVNCEKYVRGMRLYKTQTYKKGSQKWSKDVRLQAQYKELLKNYLFKSGTFP
jgi:hypothetical protein